MTFSIYRQCTYIVIPPPHSASCLSANTVYAPEGGRKTPPVQVATIWVKPSRVQVEYLCQRLREKHHVHHCKLLQVIATAITRCKVQGARCKGPASVQVRAGCSNNIQLQPPPSPPTSSGSAWALLAGVHITGIIAPCIRARLERNSNCVPLYTSKANVISSALYIYQYHG